MESAQPAATTSSSPQRASQVTGSSSPQRASQVAASTPAQRPSQAARASQVASASPSIRASQVVSASPAARTSQVSPTTQAVRASQSTPALPARASQVSAPATPAVRPSVVNAATPASARASQLNASPARRPSQIQQNVPQDPVPPRPQQERQLSRRASQSVPPLQIPPLLVSAQDAAAARRTSQPVAPAQVLPAPASPEQSGLTPQGGSSQPRLSQSLPPLPVATPPVPPTQRASQLYSAQQPPPQLNSQAQPSQAVPPQLVPYSQAPADEPPPQALPSQELPSALVAIASSLEVIQENLDAAKSQEHSLLPSELNALLAHPLITPPVKPTFRSKLRKPLPPDPPKPETPICCPICFDEIQFFDNEVRKPLGAKRGPKPKLEMGTRRKKSDQVKVEEALAEPWAERIKKFEPLLHCPSPNCQVDGCPKIVHRICHLKWSRFRKMSYDLPRICTPNNFYPCAFTCH